MTIVIFAGLTSAVGIYAFYYPFVQGGLASELSLLIICCMSGGVASLFTKEMYDTAIEGEADA
jgi:hypothetical protein